MLAQRGMFSYSGLTKDQVQTLREEFSVYAIDTGRICVAALNSRNIDDVAAAVANVDPLTRRVAASHTAFDRGRVYAIIRGCPARE